MLFSSRAHLWAAALSLAASGCLFPDYTFDEASGGGGNKATTSSSIASSSVASSSVASGTGGEGGTPPVEDCFNGTDDDGDGLADCDDPDCTADTQCVDPIPVGWGTFGFVVLAESDPASSPTCPSFAATSKYDGFSGLTNTTFSCSNCTCGGAVGQSCTLQTDLNSVTPGLQAFQVRNVPCSTMNATNIIDLTIPSNWDLSCSSMTTAAGGQMCNGQPCNSSITTGFPTVSGGMCMHMGGTLSKADPMWMTEATACGGLTLAGCTGTQKCMPKPKAPFLSSVCVGKAGDQTCPMPFTKKHLYYATFTDTRSCDACDCHDPTGGACTISLGVYSNNMCTMNDVTFNAGSCADLTGNPAIAGELGTVSVAPQGGTCTPVVSQGSALKNGDVVPDAASETTFCCL